MVLILGSIIRLIQKIKNIFENYKNTDAKTSSYVLINYSRPLKCNKQLDNEIKKILDLQLKFITEQKEYRIGENLILTFYPAKRKLKYTYYYGGEYDSDKGGMVISIIYESKVLPLLSTTELGFLIVNLIYLLLM